MNPAYSSLRLIRHTFYKLKRRLGVPAAIYKEAIGATNRKTGVKNVTRTVNNVRKMILLPVRRMPKFAYDLTWVASNKNFTYGAYFQTGDREALVDGRDLPKGYMIENQDYIVFKGKRYDIKEVHQFDDFGFYVLLRQTQEAKPYQILTPHFLDHLTVTDTFTGEL